MVAAMLDMNAKIPIDNRGGKEPTKVQFPRISGSRSWRFHELIQYCWRKLTVMIVRRIEFYEHVLVGTVITDSLDETTTRNVRACEWLEVHNTSVLYVY
jgi:hypothetical protein